MRLLEKMRSIVRRLADSRRKPTKMQLAEWNGDLIKRLGDTLRCLEQAVDHDKDLTKKIRELDQTGQRMASKNAALMADVARLNVELKASEDRFAALVGKAPLPQNLGEAVLMTCGRRDDPFGTAIIQIGAQDSGRRDPRWDMRKRFGLPKPG